ncbi:MAG: DUF1549 domain-containing protein, partial [Pirellulaceae bacterium]|nr:DUF1549 domain-containing protein [Pirellulaceae bacterium]
PPRGGQLAGGRPAVDRARGAQERLPAQGRLPGEPERGGPFTTPPPFDVAGGTNSAAARGAADTAAYDDPLPAEQVVRFVNTQLRTAWEQAEVRPAEPATEAEWCRRVFLRVLGRIPLVEELETFLADSAADKRERLVERLLHESPYVDQMADHWSGFWTNVLAGRTGGLDKNAPGDRQALQVWLRRAIVEGRPFDQMAYELISATGSTSPEAPDYNPAVHYLLINMDPRATLATTRTTQAFLGKQLQCAQCHHHPSNEWAQEQFWQFSAFFRQMRVERDGAAGHFRLVNRDFAGEGGRDAGEAEVYFERLDGKLQAAYPVFLGGEAISPSGRLEDVDRRLELARLVRSSGDLSRAVVNRVWAHFFGHGFTNAVDDMGPHSPPSHPELLEQLAGQFSAHKYDLRALLRWIALSEAFGLSSRVTEGTLADRPDAGSQPLFSRYYTRQLPPEEVYHSLELVAAARAEGQTPGTEQARLDWLGQFTRNMGTDEATETSTYAGDIRQSLIIMNGPLMRQATTPRAGSVLQQVLASEMPAEEKVEHLFLAALSRQPTRRELTLIGQMLDSAGDLNTALQDVWWALLNSNEFILDH